MSDLNQPPVGSGWGSAADPTSPAGMCLASAPAFDNCAPGQGPQPYASKFPYLNYIYWLSNSNLSNYNSLQVSMTQHETHGVSFVLGYTFAHALGESPDNWSFLSPINSANPREIYGTTEFESDIALRFRRRTTSPARTARLQLLKGWSLNSIMTLESATPWGVNDCRPTSAEPMRLIPNLPMGSNGIFSAIPLISRRPRRLSTRTLEPGHSLFRWYKQRNLSCEIDGNGSIGDCLPHGPGLLCCWQFSSGATSLRKPRDNRSQHVPGFPVLQRGPKRDQDFQDQGAPNVPDPGRVLQQI